MVTLVQTQHQLITRQQGRSGSMETVPRIPKRPSLYDLPAELRIRIFEHLLQFPPATTGNPVSGKDVYVPPNRAVAAHAQGYTSGVGHLSLCQIGATWRCVTIAGPPGFALLSPAVLRVSKRIHNEVMDILYSNMLWVINIIQMGALHCGPSDLELTSASDKESTFMQWISHVFIRQHIRPEEDLVQKSQALRSLISCLNPQRKSTQVALHFTSMHLVNDPLYPREKKPEYNWQLYEHELGRLSLGKRPHFQVSQYWSDSEGPERFENLAESLGGVVNDPDYIYW